MQHTLGKLHSFFLQLVLLGKSFFRRCVLADLRHTRRKISWMATNYADQACS